MDWKKTSADDGESRNSWINRDEPTDVSSMAHYKDGYEDILQERREKSDLKYSLRARPDVPKYKYRNARSPEDLKNHVINSDRVKYTVEKLADRLSLPQKQVYNEAQEILDEMAHTLNMKAVRGFAYFLIKIFKALFRRIYVNEEGVRQLRKLISEYPVLLMPTHRSYMDFLLISYIFYEYDLPLPVIAAAMDFSNMKFFGWLLRNCGAFYIRRSFGTDELYWAVFTEYVQTQLRNGDQPMEFFVEGTRSRTSKSYTPRIGMLSAALESYFKAELPDIMIVPISISYDRILEESLYAYELLGIPKPKESASGVFKARSILSEDFGCVHFYIADPISIRQFSNGHIDRICHALEPRYINNLTKAEVELTTKLAYQIVRVQQRHLVISPWSIMAAVLMQSWEDGITVRQLVKEAEWLKRQAYNLGAYVDWPGNTSPESVVRHYLSLHTNILSITDDRIVPKLVRPSHVRDAKVQDDSVMHNAATNIILGSYRNQLMHVFVRVAMVALSVNGCLQETMSMEKLYSQYCFLEKIMCRDFVFQPGHTKQDFEQAVLILRHSGGLFISEDHQILVKKSINKHTTFYSQMFEPFLLAYWIMCQHLLSMSGSVHGRPLPRRPKDLAKDAQNLGTKLVRDNFVKHYEVLSLDILGNGLGALTNMGAMHKDKRNEEVWLSPSHVMVSRIAEQLAEFLEVPAVQITNISSKSHRVIITAKI